MKCSKFTEIARYLSNVKFNNGNFHMGRVLTQSGNVVPHLYVLYTNNIILTDDPTITKYKGLTVHYYKNYESFKCS